MQGFERQLEQLGVEIKRLRTEKQLTQQELANMCDLDIRSIQRIETGEHNSSVGVLCALAGALEISLSVLFANVKVPKTAYLTLGKLNKSKPKKKKKS